MSIEHAPVKDKAATGGAAKPTFILVISEKEGVRTSTTALALGEYVIDCGHSLQVFQTDQQQRLATTFENCITLKMPSQDALRRNDLADANALTPLVDLLLTGGHDVVLFDVGANPDARVLDGLAAVDLDAVLHAVGAQIVVVVPTTTEFETIAVARRTISRVEIALPEALIVPIIGGDGGDLSAAKEHVKEMGSHGRPLMHPRLLPRALASVSEATVSPWRLADLPPREAIAALKLPPT